MYIKLLESRGIIRRSTSEWRNPTRELRKPNGTIRLVSNLMSLNDLVEKDEYKLANIRDIIRYTQGSKYFSVIDLKEGFIASRQKKKTRWKRHLDLIKESMSGMAWFWDLKILRKYCKESWINFLKNIEATELKSI